MLDEDTDCNNWICCWKDGTRCWLDDLEEYLVFMTDDFTVKRVSDYEAKDIGLRH